MPEAVVAFLREASQFIVKCLASVPRMRSRLPGFVDYTMSWLKRSDLRVEVSDKDGVFVVLPRSVAVELVNRELKKTVLSAARHLESRTLACFGKAGAFEFGEIA